MAIRKEQVLALLALLLGVYLWSGMKSETGGRVQFSPKVAAYEGRPVRATPLVVEGPRKPVRVAIATEPSETQSLPPRDLPFPDRAPLSLVLLPLDPGPDFGHTHLLAGPGSTVDGVVVEAAPVPAAEAAATEEPTGPLTRRQKEERAARTYDRVWQQGQSTPWFGTVECDGVADRFELEKLTDFSGLVIRLRQFSIEEEKIKGLMTFGGRDDSTKVVKVQLADNLANEVERRIRDVPHDVAHLPKLAELIDWLLAQSREDARIYDRALEQALVYRQVSGDVTVDGLRLQLRVLRQRGDLAGELALLQTLEKSQPGSAFLHESFGVLKARLRLDADAEVDLRAAATAAPNDAMVQGLLALFLLDRGRAQEALPVARRAQSAIGSVVDIGSKQRIAAVLVRTYLAVGDLAAANAALSLVPEPVPFLRASIDYAAGDPTAALAGFRNAAGGPDAMQAQLGAASCLLRLERWQEAMQAFLGVIDQAPLLRARAHDGIACLQLRLGQFDQAIAATERALEANPADAYALYLRGRALRLQGQLQPAQEALAAALRWRDDFVHAIAEMAAVRNAMAQEARGEDQALHALAAKRYAERAVRLSPVPLVEFLELEGLYRFAAADSQGALAAFGAARDVAARAAGATGTELQLYARGCLAVVDYSQGRVDDAINQLQRLATDLPKEHPMRRWAEATLRLIDDHLQKELLEDRFERQELGSIWPIDRDPSVVSTIDGNAILLRGKLTRGEVSVERSGAVPRARNFLAVQCRMQLGPTHSRRDGLAGLRLVTAAGGAAAQPDFLFECGVREGQPFLRLVEGRDEPMQQTPAIAGFDVGGEQTIEVRVHPRPDQETMWTMVVTWNGTVVLRRDLRTLTGRTQTELKTVLFAQGPRGSDVDVRFDDYRLERRKDRQ